MKVITKAVQFKADQKLIDFIEKRLQKLDQFFDKIIDAKVVLKLENSGQVRDKVAEIRVNIPGDTIVAKDTKKTFEASVDSATDSIKRRLREHKERLKAKPLGMVRGLAS